MKDLSNSSTPMKAVVTEFSSASDPRQIYNLFTNTTAMLTTEEFFEYCELYGPSYDGRFLNRIILFYSAREFPLLIMKFEESVVYIAVKYDPREFVWVPRLKPPKCSYDPELKLMQCRTPSGTYYWRRLWEAPLPYKKEWLSVHWVVKWSYKHDCVIKVTDTETNDVLVNYEGPCGQPYHMSLGYYPYVSVGLLTANINVPIGMRFRDIRFNQSDVPIVSSTTTPSDGTPAITEFTRDTAIMASPASSPTTGPNGAPIIVSTTGTPMVGSGDMTTFGSLRLLVCLSVLCMLYVDS